MQIMYVVFILIFGLSELTCLESALIPLPDRLKVQSHVSHLNDQAFTCLEVTEYVNFQDGSIRLDTDWNSTKTSYFRLMSNNEREDRLIHNTVIAYNPDISNCRSVHIKEWPMKDLSRLLIELSRPKYKLMGINMGVPNKTFLGPASLLRLVHQNSESLKLFSQSRDKLSDSNEFHFSLRLDDWDKFDRLVARLLVTVTDDSLKIDSGSSSMLGSTTLSQVGSSSRLSRITLAILDEKSTNDSKSLNKHASPEFLDELYKTDSKLVEQLTVEYNLIQEQSLSRHTGLKYLADEVGDPFMMPVGLSCGSLSNNRHFYVRATQFSGQFEADDYEGRYFAAYDEASNHLRYDVLGKSKMIYNLNDNSVTYISDDSSGADDVELNKVQQLSAANSSTTAARAGEPHHYYDRSHCAQASLMGELGPALTGSSPLYNRKKLDSILGLGEAAQLAYLGQTRLPEKDRNGQTASYEPVTCQVFERDIAHDQLPALVQMHLRLKPSEKNSLSLIYYFVDEIDSQTKRSLFNEQLNPYESMWLKRVELFSRTGFSKYIFSNARLTFSKSSWSLETISEDTRNRETQLEHPVRAFDTLECWPGRNAVRLDVVLTQQNTDEWTRKGLNLEDSRLSIRQKESFEETIMSFLSRQLGSARSRINEFELEPRAANNYESIMIRSKLTFPFSYIYKEKMIGWVESYRPLLLKKQAVLVSQNHLILPHECSLKLATRMRGPYKFFMVFCPNFGCGTLLVEPPELVEEHEEANNKSCNFRPVGHSKDPPPNLAVYNELCTIHLVSKTVQQQGMISPDSRAELLAGTLEKAALSIDSYQLDPQTREFKHVPYRTQVTKVSVTSSKSLQSFDHDERMVADVCFTLQTRPLKGQEQMQLPYGNGSLVIKQLPIDRHHSQAHCRKACVLFEPCETYSYNHVERLCVLTNILPDLLRDAEITFEHLLVRQNECNIYALDQLIRFKRTPAVVTKSAADMIQYHGEESNSSLILWDDLGGCARFAHSASWAMSKLPDQYALSSFGFMRLKQLCLIHGVDREQFLTQFSSARDRLITNSADLRKYIVGPQDQLSELEAYETFQANPAQFYTRKIGYSIEILDEATETLTKLNDQDFDRCLDTCTNKDKDCVMFDFCAYNFNGRYIRECNLLHVRSPFAIELLARLYEKTRYGSSVQPLKMNASAADQKLTPLEQDLYVEGRSKSQAAIKVSNHCQHYYLSGDNLHLKQLLAQDQKVLDAGKPVACPGKRLDANPLQEQIEAIEFSWIMWLELFLGLAIGCGIFIVQPTITELITKRQVSQAVRQVSNQQIERIRQALGPGGWRQQAGQSQPVQLTEMVRMG